MPAHVELANPRPRTGLQAYLWATRSASYGFLSALPLLLLYEVLIVLANGTQIAQVRVGAEVWLKQLLAFFGATGMGVLGIIVLVIGIAVFAYERRKAIPIRLKYLLGLVGESAVYAVVTALLVSTAVGVLFAVAPVGPQQAMGLWTQLALSIGAGLYEELVFRVLLVGGLFWVLRRLMRGEIAAYVVAALVGALLFSAVHYIGALGDPFELPSFVFRFFFGLVLNVIFLVRGFGVAAWTHALYDVLVVTGFFR